MSKQWEMYDAASYIGVRRADDKSKVCAVALGPRDLDAARLIEAAPELLAAAKRALAIFRVQGESVRSGAVTGALADAIARATASEVA